MANYQSQFDFVLSAGVDTASIKQDILKAYKDVQVNINGQKLTISNITIDSKNALESFKEQINKIGLSNGIKIEIDTKEFKEAQTEITRLQTLLDKTNLKSIDKKFQKNSLTETFKSLSQTVQKFTKEDLDKFSQAAEKAWNSLSRKRGSFDDYKEEYIYNQKLYEVMKNQKTELEVIQKKDGWSNDVESLSRAYELIKSITAIQSKLSSTKYSREAFEDLNVDNISNLDIDIIKEKYKSLANNTERDIRKYEGILHDEFNNLIESWVNGAQQINNAPITPEIKTEGVKERIEELQKDLEVLQSQLQISVAKIAQAELSVEKNLPGAEGVLREEQQRFDVLSQKIKQTKNDIVDLKIESSDFTGFSEKDLNVKIDETTKSINKLTRQIEQLDATKIDIAGLSDDEIINRMKKINNELTSMISGKTGPQKAQIINTSEYKNLLAQFKQLYEYAKSNNLDLSEANTGINSAVLNARVTQTKNISLFNEELYNSLVSQRNVEQTIVDKCQEELRLRQNIVQELVEAEKAQQSVTNTPTVIDNTSKTDVATVDDKSSQVVETTIPQKVKLVPDVSTFKLDADTALSAIPLNKEIKLTPDISTLKTDVDAVLPNIPLAKTVKLTPDASALKVDSEIVLSTIPLNKEVVLTPVSGTDSSSVITQESDAFDTVKQSVTTLTQAINDKTTAITQEKIAMDVAAQSEVASIQSIEAEIDILNTKIQTLSDLKFEITGFDKLENVKNLDLSKVQIQDGTLNKLTNLSYVLETLKSILNDSSLSGKLTELKTALSGLNLSELKNLKFSKDAFSALSTLKEDDVNNLMLLAEVLKDLNKIPHFDKESLSGLKITKAQAENFERAAQGITNLKASLTGFDSVTQSIGAIDTLINKIAVLKGVVNSIKDIKVEVIEDTTTGKKKTTVKDGSVDQAKKQAVDIKQLNNSYTDLFNTLKRINELRILGHNDKLSTSEQQELTDLLNNETKLRANIDSFQKQGIENQRKALELQELQNNLVREFSEKTGGSEFKLKDSDTNKYNKVSKIDANQYINSAEINKAKATLNNLYDEMTSGAKRSAEANKNLRQQFNEQVEVINRLTQSTNLLTQNNGAEYIGNVASGTTIKQSKDEILSLINTLKLGEVSFDTFTQGHRAMIVSIKGSDNQIRKYKIALDQTTGAVTSLYLNEKKYTSFGAKWITGVKKKFVELTQYMSGISLITRVWTELQRGFTIVRELDTAFTEMRKVSDETVSSLKNFQKESFNIADSVGATASTIQNSTADWMRLGESINEAAESAKVSNILFNVSEFEDINSATESLVSMSQAYQNLEKIDIVDKLNNVGNNYQIATDGLATALQKSASALTTAGNDIDEAIALITAGNAVVQDPDSVGAAMRTISLRLTGTTEAKEELEELGEETDDVVTTVSKLRDTILSATKVESNGFKGFDILDENGNYKSTYEIMLGISEVYQEIVETDKKMGTNNINLLLETIAGKNRANVAASILQNNSLLENVYKSSQDSSGSAQEELDKYLDSIEGKINQLTNNIQEFWSTFIDTDLVKGAIDVLSNIVQFGTNIVDTFGSAGAVIAGALSVFAIHKSGGRAKKAVPLLS